MSKTHKITDATAQAPPTPVPGVKAAKPVGNQILVELLTPQEILGTTLHVGDKPGINGAPQAYIRAIGPKVDPDYGFQVGDRIVLSGTFTPLPEVAATNG